MQIKEITFEDSVYGTSLKIHHNAKYKDILFVGNDGFGKTIRFKANKDVIAEQIEDILRNIDIPCYSSTQQYSTFDKKKGVRSNGTLEFFGGKKMLYISTSDGTENIIFNMVDQDAIIFLQTISLLTK